MSLGRLYPSHVPLGTASKLVLAAGTSLGAFMFPQRADLVAAFGELSGAAAFKQLHQRMSQHPTGQLILQEKPIITVRADLRTAMPARFGHLQHAHFSALFSLAARHPVLGLLLLTLLCSFRVFVVHLHSQGHKLTMVLPPKLAHAIGDSAQTRMLCRARS